ncbi:hypothetical protein BV20DRAFT_1027465 [Pilatotrama ljubarskyi]|nr:hypothetical protein BV20DRAFT_1027465 [Pilatotrama ljubarskyi]
MTEYATDPEAIQEFLTARDRTANWVNVHAGGINFVSPSSPPSIISDSDAPSYGPSESDSSSTHSTPPRMVLRYPDGRPDVPISSDGVPSPTSSRRSHTYGPQSSSRHTRSRSGSHAPPPAAEVPPASAPRYAQTLPYATGSRYAQSTHPHITPPRSPESIRVLPSRQPEEPQSPVRVSASNSSHHSRVPAAQAIFHPQPRQPSIHPSIHTDRVPPLADPLHTSNRSVMSSTPHASAPVQTPSYAVAPGGIAHSQSQPATMSYGSGSRFVEHAGTAPRVQSQLPYTYSPPAIVYAPSSRHAGSNYNPPAIVYSPSSHGHHRRAPAPGIAYSRSDPLPHPTPYSPQHTNAGSTPYPSVHGSTSHHTQRLSHRSSQSREEPQSHSRSHASSAVRGRPSARDLMHGQHSHGRTRSPTPSLSESDTASDTSGSTYYVLPSPGQKVQIVVPNSASVYTATGGHKSPRSPGSRSSSGSPKKPFFQRLFSRGSGSVDSRGSNGQGKRLHRRHTVAGAHSHPSTASRR